MSDFDSLGLGPIVRLGSPAPTVDWVIRERPLRRVLQFTRRMIDDVVNSQIAKNEVLGYFKLQKNIGRRMEIVELEKQWNAVG